MQKSTSNIHITLKEKGLKQTHFIFQEDIFAQLWQWRKKGNRVVPVMDDNKYVLDGALFKQLTVQTTDRGEPAHAGSGP